MSVTDKIREYRDLVPADVEIVAVSKFHPAEMILEAYEAGQRLFGESRVQELLQKQETLPQEISGDIKWHFIGHLQTNKVKQLVGRVALIESVDSERLLRLIDKESQRAGVITEVLLQVHVAMEEQKFGFYPQELREFLAEGRYKDFPNVKIRGLMGMASNVESEERVAKDFCTLHQLYEEVKATYFGDDPGFDKLSMGMSGDWPLAVEEGATLIRVGSAIFGERHY